MFIDALLQFDDKVQKLSAAKSDNIINVGSARNVGTGETLYIAIVLTAAMAGASAVTVTLETDDNSGMASPTQTQVLGEFPAASPAGTIVYAKIDPKKFDEQYAQLDYAFSGAANTAGDFSAFITNSIDDAKSYPIAYVI